MADILQYGSFYLVGIKGVAMTSLAQCLLDADKQVTGSDVEADFVTHPLLLTLPVHIDTSFNTPLPADVECVIYTSAHQADSNSQVAAAKQQGLPVFSQAEALASLFNQKQGIAVGGVGGKSTTSAMIAWILEKAKLRPSFSIGVGDIPGLHKTGQWVADSPYFVAEADEYVINPNARQNNQAIIPRFSFLKPSITVCTNIKFDHPDVYTDLAHTKQVFAQFFAQLKPDGILIVNGEDPHIREILTQTKQLNQQPYTVITYGENTSNQTHLMSYHSRMGKTTTVFSIHGIRYTLELHIPGKYNSLNALAAITAAQACGVSIETSIAALQSFRSTKRRFEAIGTKNGVTYYDDYAHHPSEVKAAIQALREWYPNKRVVIAFQPHTFSRTKMLFDEFVESFSPVHEVVMIDIFGSAREKSDDSVSSDSLCTAIQHKHPTVEATNLHTITNLKNWCQTELKAGDVLITLGAGDIYQVHELLV